MTPAEYAQTIFGDQRLKSYVAGITGCAERADDVLQAVAEKFLREPPPARNLRAFIFSSARNAAIDELRATERRGHREQAYATRHEAEEASMEVQLDKVRGLERLQSALAELPLLTQSMFQDYYVRGLSQRDIAARLGLHVSTVEKRLSKARRHCYRRLASRD
ncbi:MAG: RNA polymerase sigma factor [Pseudomonadota bacterium]